MKKDTQNKSTGNTGTLEAAKDGIDWIDKSPGAKVQNPNQNKEIHKQGLGRNSNR